MSVVHAHPAGRDRRWEAWTATGTLARFMLRRDRVRLPAWTAGFAVFVVYLCTALPSAYPREDLPDAVILFSDPVGRMLTGPGLGLDAPDYDRLVAGGYALYLLLLAALMSILLVSRHTRAEEQTGRAELVRADVVGRHAPLTAALLVALVWNVVVAAVVLLVLVAVGGAVAGGFAVTGSVLLAAGVAVTGLAFAGVTTVTVQLSEYSRAASGLAGAALAAAFVLRAGGDVVAPGGSALSWTSPLGQVQQTGPYVLDRWWPLLPPLALAAVSAAVGFALSTRRDVGASLFAVRPGPAHARPGLGTPVGLAVRLQRTGLLWWAFALTLAGLTFGAFTGALLDAAADLPETFAALFRPDDVVGAYLAYLGTFTACFAAVAAVLAVQGVRSGETAGHTEQVLAAPVARATWWGANVLVVAVASAATVAVAGVGTGIGAWASTGDGALVGASTAAHLNQVPAVWVVAAVAALLLGVWPRAVTAASALAVHGLLMASFGPLLGVPDAVVALSPFEHAAAVPSEDVRVGPLLALATVAVAAAVVGVIGYRRRDIGS